MQNRTWVESEGGIRRILRSLFDWASDEGLLSRKTLMNTDVRRHEDHAAENNPDN